MKLTCRAVPFDQMELIGAIALGAEGPSIPSMAAIVSARLRSRKATGEMASTQVLIVS
jgi:hypothetical protein